MFRMGLFRLVLTALAVAMIAKSSEAQSAARVGQAALGSSTENVPVSVTVSHAGAVDRIDVTTAGSKGLDFQMVGNSCIGIGHLAEHQSCTVNVVFRPTAVGERRGAIVLLDARGNALGARPMAGSAVGPIANFISGQITSVAGNSSFLYGGDGVVATSTSLFLPFGVTLDGAGDLYIADTYNSRIRRVDHATQIITTVAGDGVAGFSGDGGAATAGHLNNPSSVALDSQGNIYIADTNNDAVRVVSASTGIITTVAGTPGQAGYSGDTGPATLAKLQGPNGLALDTNGNLYIADTANNVVREVNSLTGTIVTFAGTGRGAYTGDGRAATQATLNGPWGLAFSATDDLYIGDQTNNVIRKVSPLGIISTAVGNGLAGFSGDGNSATIARLNKPSNMAFDAAGDLYIADSGNNRIRKINPTTNFISTVAGDNNTNLGIDGQPANFAALYGPYAIAVDGNADIFIADVFHNRIREVPSNVAILTYPTLRVNSVSAVMNQTIENDGTGPLSLSQIMAVSNGQLAPSTTCSTTTPLAPLAQCVIAATFNPTTTGTPVMGSITINSDAVNAPNTLLLQADVTSTSPSTVILSSSPDPSIVGNPVTFTVQVISSAGVPTGKVQLLDGSSPLVTLTLSNGLASTVISDLTVGQHTITGSYSGDVNYGSSVSQAVLQIVNPVPANSMTTTTISSSANPVSINQPVTLTATVAAVAAGQVQPTGTVIFSDGNTALGTTNLTAGTAALAVPSLSAGTHCLTATYSGDSLYATSTSACLNELVTSANPATTITLISSSDPTVIGAPVTFTASVAAVVSGQAAPSGTVQFLDGAAVIANSTSALSAGQATFTDSALAVGTHLITAIYSGDANYTSSTSPVLTQVVLPPAGINEFTFTVTPASLSVASGAHASLQITVNSLSTFTDTLQFGCGGLPASATCSFGENGISVTNGASKTLTVVLDTANPLGSGAAGSSKPLTTLAGNLTFGALCLLGFRSRRKLLRRGALLGGSLSLLILLSGCGSSINKNNTPPGSYTFQIFASGSTTGLSYYVSVPLTVTK